MLKKMQVVMLPTNQEVGLGAIFKLKSAPKQSHFNKRAWLMLFLYGVCCIYYIIKYYQ